jgi:hypothetical protein
LSLTSLDFFGLPQIGIPLRPIGLTADKNDMAAHVGGVLFEASSE